MYNGKYSVTIFAVREKLGLSCREVHGANHYR